MNGQLSMLYNIFSYLLAIDYSESLHSKLSNITEWSKIQFQISRRNQLVNDFFKEWPNELIVLTLIV